MKAWADVLSFPRPGRASKPRLTGLTMVIDKGLPPAETTELLALAGDYIDILKLTFGTSAFYTADLLRRKTDVCRRFAVDVMPGGTFLEIAVLQRALPAFLERARELGFTAIEVSDGTVRMSASTRNHVIRAVREAGFRVISEVGKKDPADQLPVERMLAQIASDLAAGTDFVVLEGRESGRGVGIYGGDGLVKETTLEELIAGLEHPDRIIWEAPLKEQQHALIRRLGSNVSLGNIPPTEVLAVEALRVGLRGDTLRDALKNLVVPELDGEPAWPELHAGVASAAGV